MTGLRKNNKGAALLLVICSLSILSVIGSLLLVKTRNNRKMKLEEKQAQKTFSEAEESSMELASALESVAQDAVKSSFADLMLEYGSIADNDARIDRFNEVFVSYLCAQLNKSNAAELLVKNALHMSASDSLDVTVSFEVDEHGNNKIITETTEDKADKMTTNKITIKNAKFSYNDGAGNQSSIVTDICVTAKIPDVQAAMVPEAAALFEDFVLISNGNVSRTSASSGTDTTKMQGNIYIGGNYSQEVNGAIEIKDAAKFLVKGSIDLKSAGAKLSFINAKEKDADNKSLWDSGLGLWAGNISVSNGATFFAEGNCYVRDDLSVAGTGTKVEIAGTEYLGYGGGSERKSESSSAITINTAKNITVDLRNVGTLMLRGSSYIQDTKWGNTSLTGEDKTANLYGVLQGESLAYKEMQAMYLVPSSCSFNGKNPMLKSDYDSAVNKSILMNFVETGLDLSDYVNEEKPYVTRFVRLDGGSKEYVYLYLNFKSEAAAAAYHKAYMQSAKGDVIREQIKLLEDSMIALPDPEKCYTISDLVEYNKNGDKAVNPLYASGIGSLTLRNKSNTAARMYGGLFSRLDATVTKTVGEDYDLIRSSVVNESALAGSPKTVTEGEYTFYFRSGAFSTSSLGTNKKGILLVDGDLTVDNSFKFDGLILVTGEVKYKAQGGIDLKADKTAVRTLLGNSEVAAFFRGHAGADGIAGSGSYISSESVKIEFENWNRN